MSAGVKAAAFAALVVRVFFVLGSRVNPAFVLWLFSILAVLSMALGNLLALPQRNLKRMLAYSSIAHAGYVLVGVTALFASAEKSHCISKSAPHVMAQGEVLRGILLYLFAYAVTALGPSGCRARAPLAHRGRALAFHRSGRRLRAVASLPRHDPLKKRRGSCASWRAVRTQLVQRR